MYKKKQLDAHVYVRNHHSDTHWVVPRLGCHLCSTDITFIIVFNMYVNVKKKKKDKKQPMRMFQIKNSNKPYKTYSTLNSILP